ncbi:MAG: sulfatase-like hydrolase/transferase [Sedimentisphaerales bacterium]|nr:sulfatase-like hydrolase/transferase [Sedimentisphaerales bacterium]
MDESLSKRNFLGWRGGSIAATHLKGRTVRSATQKKPNFILIFADDLGYGDINGFGLTEPSVETPHLSRMAASEDFYTPDTPDDLYADVIRELDFSIGRIFQKLKQLDLDKDTFVIFTSDNGPWYGGSTRGHRGMKGKTWEGGLRVPMIARWPGTIPAGIVNPSPAGTIDIFPTILNAAGVDIPRDRIIDGEDIWSLLTST